MSDTRREFLQRSGLALLALPVFGLARTARAEDAMSTEEAQRFVSKGSAALGGSFAVDPDWERDNQALVKSFVLPCHFALEEAREILKQDSRLVNARLHEFDEAPIEAASHMGRPDIAQFLLGNGAPYTVHCSVMLGHAEAARSFFERDRSQARRPGAHGIPMMFHAAISGVIEMVELLEEYGAGQDYDRALSGAAGWGQLEMAELLLQRGADVNYISMRKTALDWATQRDDNEALVRLLKAHGAVPAAELPAPEAQ